ncbi:TonB-dependent receptor [uncultured Algibacter sp.]|uniref:SusC/RagA family TonB-linked outer membrane protein n=1 Tax=uncultured Algibacter sp. TaxID=298659 RepID=UPI002637B115|nr:TonB-dependent receptor [uncultured Algibacter sp.]
MKNFFKASFVKKGAFKVLLMIFMGYSIAGFAIDDSVNSISKYNIQERTITGVVTDQGGIPLPGVAIVVKGTSKGTSTDFDGNYTISVNKNDTLVFSYLGFITQEILVGTQTKLTIVLQEDVSQLDEVVVVGYGTQSKKDLTGSVSIVGGDDLVARSTTNVSNALQGQVAGVTVTRSSSAPGSGNTIRIRGISTLVGSSDPLVLVDDVPVGSINDVNPDQIESMSILKDGASASIYGSRAAAGVILITTKKAKTGKFTASYSGEYVINTPTQIRRPVGVIRYLEMFNEQVWNDAGNDPDDQFPQFDEEFINNYLANNQIDPDNFPNTNWRDLILKKNSTGNRHSMTFSAGSEKVKTVANFGYESQDALYAGREWKRITGRINNSLKFTDKFGADFNFAFKLTDSDTPGVDPTVRAIEGAPIYAAVWENGNVAEGKTGENIHARLHHGGFTKSRDHLFYGKFGLHFKPISSLKLSVNIAPKYNFTKWKDWNQEIPYWAFDNAEELGAPEGYIIGHASSNITLQERRDSAITLTTQFLANFDETFGDHTVNAVVGYEEFKSEVENFRVDGNNYLDNNFPFINRAPIGQIFNNGTSFKELAYRSMFSRASYDYKKKYLIQGSIRRDGSSRFGSDYRYGNFPSVSAGWVISKENFMKPFSKTISFLKFRASYGELGNDRLGSNYLYQANIQLSDVLFTNGNDIESLRSGGQVNLAIPDITWETTKSTNFAIDLNMFNDKLSLTGEYFEKKTENMLLGRSLLRYFGYPDPDDNVGEMTNTGWEASATWRDNIGEFNYSITANMFDSKSNIDFIDGKEIFPNNTNFIQTEGQEFNTFFGLQSDGIFQTQEDVDNSPVLNNRVGPGDVKYKDISGPDGVPDGIISDEDRTFLGGALPRYQYGGTITMGYKGFDFGLTFQGVGKDLSNIGSAYIRPFKESFLSPPALYDGNYWSAYNTPEQNLVAKYPKLSETSAGNNYRFSDFYLKDASYLRIKNITLGYTLPSEVFTNTGISRIRIYVSGNDLFTFDNLPDGIDPEQGGGDYLITKSYIVGLKLNF